MLIYMLLACRHTRSARVYVIIFFFTEKIKLKIFFLWVESMDLSLCDCPVALAMNRPTASRDVIVSCV